MRKRFIILCVASLLACGLQKAVIADETLSTASVQDQKAKAQDEINTRLLRACAAGKVSEVNKLLEQGADIEVKDVQLEGTPLVFAIVYGHFAVVKSLLKKGAGVEARTKEYGTPLLMACANGNKDMVNLLLDEKADIDARLSDGRNAFGVALEHKRQEVLRLLIEKGRKSRWAETKIIGTAGSSEGCVNVRKDAEVKSPKVRCLKPGETVTLNGYWTNNDWVQIYEPVEGWVPAANIDTTNLPSEKRLILSFQPTADRGTRQEPDDD